MAGCGASSAPPGPAGVDGGVDSASDGVAPSDGGATPDAAGDAPGDATPDVGGDAVGDAAVDAFDGAPADGGDGTTDAADAADGDGNALDTGGGSDRGDAGGGRPEILIVATYLGGISSFLLDPTSGAPTPATSSLDSGAQFYGVAAHPSGDFVYAADLRGRVYGYRVDRAVGTLAGLSGMPLTIGGQAISAAIDPQGRFLYVVNSGDNSLYAYVIDPTSGALNPVMASPFMLGATPAGVCFHPSAGYAYVSSSALSATTQGGIRVFRVDPISGVPAELDDSPFATAIFGGALTVHPGGNFLFDGAFGVHVLAIDPTTGGVRELDDSPRAGARSDNSAADIAVDPLGQFLYASDNAGTVTAYRVDATTGAFGMVDRSPFDIQPMPYSLAVDPTGRFVYVGNDDADEVSAFSLDRVTGGLNSIGVPVVAHGLQPEMVVIGP